MQIGDINLLNSTIDAEIRLGILERALDFIMSNNFSLNKPSQQQIDGFKAESLKAIQAKYPNMGIQAK